MGQLKIRARTQVISLSVVEASSQYHLSSFMEEDTKVKGDSVTWSGCYSQLEAKEIKSRTF